MSARRRTLAALAVALVLVAACGGASGDDVETGATTSSTTTAPDADRPADETLELDRGPGAPSVANRVPARGPDAAIGRPGFTRYVYVESAGQTIPSLVEGPVGQQLRCQAPELPCSAQELRTLLADGDPIPPELGLDRSALAALVEQLNDVQDAIDAFPDAATACAAGFRPDRTQTPNMGSHFVSLDRILDGEFAPGRPEIILFARADGEAPDGPLGRCRGDSWDGVDVVPVGVAYFQAFEFVGDDHFEGFSGDFDNWHVHYNLCRLDGRDITVPPSVCASQSGTVGEFEPDQGPTGDASEGWMIHAWADRDHDSQLGVFSMWNPSIWPVSDAGAVASDAASDARRGAGTEVIDDFTLPDVRLDSPGRLSFFNADGVAHNVTAGTPESPRPEWFDSGILDSRGVATIDVQESGDVPYFCSLHPDMRGTISVG